MKINSKIHGNKQVKDVNQFQFLYLKDGQVPDYKVFWKDKNTSRKGYFNIFTYNNGMGIIKAIFKILYPEKTITCIESCSKMLSDR